MPGTYELNQKLLEECTSETIDYFRAEELLQLGAEPMGRVVDEFGDEDNLYSVVVDALWDNHEEDLFRVTELFLRYGMDVSKPSVPYDNIDVLHPLWMFGFPSEEYVLMALKLLLDHGLKAEDVAECWHHFMGDSVDVSGDLSQKGYYDFLYGDIRKLMMFASYPHVISEDEHLRREVWYDYNQYDLTKFRHWDDFDFEVDTSLCTPHPEVYRSVVTIMEKDSGKKVWRFGVCLNPEDHPELWLVKPGKKEI